MLTPSTWLSDASGHRRNWLATDSSGSTVGIPFASVRLDGLDFPTVPIPGCSSAGSPPKRFVPRIPKSFWAPRRTTLLASWGSRPPVDPEALRVGSRTSSTAFWLCGSIGRPPWASPRAHLALHSWLRVVLPGSSRCDDCSQDNQHGDRTSSWASTSSKRSRARQFPSISERFINCSGLLSPSTSTSGSPIG